MYASILTVREYQIVLLYSITWNRMTYAYGVLVQVLEYSNPLRSQFATGPLDRLPPGNYRVPIVLTPDTSAGAIGAALFVWKTSVFSLDCIESSIKDPWPLSYRKS